MEVVCGRIPRVKGCIDHGIIKRNGFLKKLQDVEYSYGLLKFPFRWLQSIHLFNKSFGIFSIVMKDPRFVKVPNRDNFLGSKRFMLLEAREEMFDTNSICKRH